MYMYIYTNIYVYQWSELSDYYDVEIDTAI